MAGSPGCTVEHASVRVGQRFVAGQTGDAVTATVG
jgi:hypothetical protein